MPKDTFRFTLYHWRNPALSSASSDVQATYSTDTSMALHMKAKVCGHSEALSLGACGKEELPPTQWEEDGCVVRHPCEMCKAIVSGGFGVVLQSRERPSIGAGREYDALLEKMGRVCAEMPTRVPLRSVGEALEACEDMWEEHATHFARLAFDRSEKYALKLCSERLGICKEDMNTRQLYSLAPKREKKAGGDQSDEASDDEAPSASDGRKQEL